MSLARVVQRSSADNATVIMQRGTFVFTVDTEEVYLHDQITVGGMLLGSAAGGIATPGGAAAGSAGEIRGTFDGQGAVLVAGAATFYPVESDGTIAAATLVGDVAGAVTVTVKRYSPAAGALGAATTLGTIALASAQHARDATLTGWTKTLTAGDVVEISIGGTITSVTKLWVSLKR